MIGRHIHTKKPITLMVAAGGGMTTSAAGISLGLITAELVINALKHAFPNDRTGAIVVKYEQLTQKNKGAWCLSVADDGVGITVDPARKEGLGTTIVSSLARQLGAQVVTHTGPQGTTVLIEHA